MGKTKSLLARHAYRLEAESADINGRTYPIRQLKPPAPWKGEASCNERDDVLVDSDADEAVTATR